MEQTEGMEAPPHPFDTIDLPAPASSPDRRAALGLNPQGGYRRDFHIQTDAAPPHYRLFTKRRRPDRSDSAVLLLRLQVVSPVYSPSPIRNSGLLLSRVLYPTRCMPSRLLWVPLGVCPSNAEIGAFGPRRPRNSQCFRGVHRVLGIGSGASTGVHASDAGAAIEGQLRDFPREDFMVEGKGFVCHLPITIQHLARTTS